MPGVSRFEDAVDVGSDMDFERRWWQFERIMWVVMTLFILAGLAGLFGRGVLSKATRTAPGLPLSLHYDRFLRFQTPVKLYVTLTQGAVSPNNQIRIWMNQSLVDTIKMGEMLPQPLSVESVKDGMVLTFSADPKSGYATIVFTQAGADEGALNGAIAVSGMTPLRFAQFIFP